MKISQTLSLLFSMIFVSVAMAQAPATKAKPTNNALQQIDPDEIAKQIKRGKFALVYSETDADGKSTETKESACVDNNTAQVIPMSVIFGVAGCDPKESRVEGRSMLITAVCKNKKNSSSSTPGAEFFSGTMQWNQDGTTIDIELKRMAMQGDKPGSKVNWSLKQKYTFVSAPCSN